MMRLPFLRTARLWGSFSHLAALRHNPIPQHGGQTSRVSLIVMPPRVALCTDITESPDSKPKVKKTVHNIVDYIARKVAVKLDSAQAVSVVSYLINESIPPQHIADGFKTNNSLLGFKPEQWERAVTVLKNYGFKNPQIMPILHSHHALFHGDTKHLYSIGESLRYVGFRDGALQKLLVKDPTLLELDPADINLQYSQLRENFKAIEIIAMALESPSILYEQYKELDRKITYLNDTMGIDYDVIAKCYVLGFPFVRIKARHLFLERAGLYRRPNPKKVINYENPSLSQMVRFTDKRFAKKIAGMTELEYKTFEKMIVLDEKSGEGIDLVLDDHYAGTEQEFDGEDSDDEEQELRDNYKKKQ